MAGAGGGAAAAAAAAVQQPAAAGRSSTSSAGGGGGGVADPRAEALRCPRCDSANTKFCYYNNYSLSQPRHFCKACKRYWTRGGTLRNVPVGGGCRKNKRSRSANGGAGRPGGSCAVAAAGGASSNAAGGGNTSLQQPGSLSSALQGLHGHGSSSLASLLLGSGGSGGDHLGLFHAMQSVVSDATAYEMQQQHQTQVDQLLGLGYGANGNGSQIQMKPWQQHFQDGAGGLFDGFYAPLLSGSIVPGLEELHVKAEATAGEQHNHQEKKQPADGERSWDQHTTSSSNVEANIMASDALMAAAAAASMNPAVSNAATAPASSSLMYWGNGGIGGSPAAWPDMANCGSSIATFF